MVIKERKTEFNLLAKLVLTRDELEEDTTITRK